MHTDLRKDGTTPSEMGANKYQEALLVWLRWNDAHERITTSLYGAGQDTRQIEQMLDHLDQLRMQAVRLSQELLDSTT
jgi:hypothetical protein